MISEDTKKARQYFMPIAVFEHQFMPSPILSTYDICDRLWPLWNDVKGQIGDNCIDYSVESVLELNRKIAEKLDVDSSEFRDQNSWREFIDECGSVEDDPEHVCSWIFSALYWDRLTSLRLVTAWFYINLLRIQNELPIYVLSVEKLGPFLESLSSSGPPLYDGQTFYPGNYSEDNT